MQKRRLDRLDGRYLYWYAFDDPLPEPIAVDEQERGDGQIELRYNALLGEYVIISTGRQGRTFRPPAEYCPLCPTASPDTFATEIPSSTYEVAVFENRFPSFRPDAPAVTDESSLLRRMPAAGVCEVVVYTPDHDGHLASLGDRRIRQLVDVWTDRYAELSARPEVAYVFIFENRGKEIGVTLTHPHGQIYAFPFLPPRVAQEHAAAAAHHAGTNRCLQCDIVAEEIPQPRIAPVERAFSPRVAPVERAFSPRISSERIVTLDDGFIAYVPFAARLPYEVHVAATEHRESLLDLTDAERDALARTLRRVQLAYDALWGFPMPYTMSMHQRAADGAARPGDHLHIEFMPPYRTKDKLKYLASVETGAGAFINDTAPEEKAAELREALERSTKHTKSTKQ